MEKIKVFVSAYACEPGLGSEIGVGWHWVLEMSKNFELWVLTRKSNQQNIEQWMNTHKEQYNINFIYFDLPKPLRFWKRGMHGVRTYYTIWQTLTNRIVKKTMLENNIEIYHLLTYGNSLWKASRYGMKQFFIWGPTGGVDTIPAEYSKHYNMKSRLIEFVRRMIVRSLPLNYGFNKRCRNANLILCKSHNMYDAVPAKYRDKAILFTDVAVEMNKVDKTHIKENNSITKYIVVGKLDAWRAFDVLVEAFAKAHQINSEIQLEIIGERADWDRLNSLIEDKKMRNNIYLTGKVSMEEYFRRMEEADVIVNSSLKEGAVTVAFDSMALAKPLICVDTGGYTRYFNNENAIVLQRGKREQLVDDMSDAIIKLADKNVRVRLGEQSHKDGNKYTWEHKGKAIYEEIIKAYCR